LTTYFNAEKPPPQQHRFPFAATFLPAGKFPGFRAPSEFEASAGEAEQGTQAQAARICFFSGKLGHFIEDVAWWP
jgi:hypothetical protein